MKRQLGIFTVIIIMISIVLYGCSQEDEVINRVSIEPAAYMRQETDATEIFSLNSEKKYEKIDTDKVIFIYNEKSQNYVYLQQEHAVISNKEEDFIIEDKNISNLKFSNDGNYLLYFIEDEILQPSIIDVNNKENIKINNKGIISGKYIEWLSDEELIYYGVDNEKRISGIFTYNIKTQQEEMIYEVKGGYVQFIKNVGDKVIFMQTTLENQKTLYMVSSDNKIEALTEDIIDISDVTITDKGIFFLGKAKNNNYSLYEIVDGQCHRLIFDFPSIINVSKGITKDKDGGILFVGGTDSYKEECIYRYYDGNVSLIANKEGTYEFLKVN